VAAVVGRLSAARVAPVPAAARLAALVDLVGAAQAAPITAAQADLAAAGLVPALPQDLLAAQPACSSTTDQDRKNEICIC